MIAGTLPVTLDLIGTFELTRRAMLAEERKPLNKRDPRPAIRLYAMTEVLAVMLDAANIPVDKNDPDDVLHELARLVSEIAKDDRAGALRALAAMNRENPHSTR